MKLPGLLWLAELGSPHTVWVYPVLSKRMDVVNTGVGPRIPPELGAEREGDRSV